MKTFKTLSYSLTGILLLLFSLSGCKEEVSGTWEMKQAPLMTQWADQVDPTKAWDVYPRPQMKRNNWENLNGIWEYSITGVDQERPQIMDGNILVPFPVESALSGVMKRVGKDDKIWYKRTLKVNSRLKSNRILLNFEAVDWQAEVFIDGTKVGEHKGGYDPFSVDITSYIRAGVKHELWVSVWDPTSDGYQPVGKQTKNPRGIWYTPSSGIWQTVWLEKVPSTYIKSYEVVPDIDNNEIKIRVDCENWHSRDELEVLIRDGNKVIAELEIDGDEWARVEIPDARLWSPDDPFLYEIDIKLVRKRGRLDKVSGYFGMRKISLGKDENGITRMMLNNEFVFQNGPLDQGFWPDGLYTAPSEEAMVYDIKVTKEMGFNMLRKHVKVEPRRFYYWTDKIGLLVWQDMPNGSNKDTQAEGEIEPDTEATDNFERELREMINTLRNHPSIVMWVPFNEGWGQYETEKITEMVKGLDPSRLVNNASGWTDKGVGDVLDIHHYPEPRAPEAEDDRAIVLGEFGGLGLMVQDHMWQKENWGYEKMENAEDLTSKYEDFYQEVFRLVENPGLSAVVYTQTTDVETETNGLMTYDRFQVKMGIENIARAHAGYLAPRLKAGTTQFIDSYSVELSTPAKGADIFYTLDGTDPDEDDQKFSSPFNLSETSTLKSIAIFEDGIKSRISEYKIVKVDPTPGLQIELSQGLDYKYYEGAWEIIPDFSLLEPVKIGVAQKLDLQPSRGKESDFGIVFKGYINVPATGVYNIYVSSDDGARLILDGEELIIYDGIHGMGEKKASAALEKGFHPVEFHYFQHLGGLGLKVSWESNEIGKEEISPKFFGR